MALFSLRKNNNKKKSLVHGALLVTRPLSINGSSRSEKKLSMYSRLLQTTEQPCESLDTLLPPPRLIGSILCPFLALFMAGTPISSAKTISIDNLSSSTKVTFDWLCVIDFMMTVLVK